MVPVVGTVSVAQAAGLSIIRDAEVESTIRSYANPLFVAGGINPDMVTIRVIGSDVLNAFVTNGNRMFIYSGLILKTKTPGELTGVIAHESGHIAGGHMVRLGDQQEKTMLASVGAMALGLLTGIATSSGDAGMAAMSLGQQVATRKYFSFTRSVEGSADQFAMKVLDRTHQSAQGLLDFFGELEGEEMLQPENQDPYVRTHPLTQDRIDAVRAHVEEANIPYGATKEQQLRHDRMVAKLYAFLKPQASTLQRYPESDTSLVARYARTIAYFRRGQMDKAVPLIEGLLKEHPDDPYFWELKGQMLFENGRVPEAAEAYRKATSLAPDQPMIDLSFGHVLVELGTPKADQEAEGHLRKVLVAEPNSAFAWRLLGTAYGQQGDETQASYARAEYAQLTGDKQQALFYVNKALKGIRKSDPLWLRLQDLKNALDPDGKSGGPEDGGTGGGNSGPGGKRR